jgi:hypothetical protein
MECPEMVGINHRCYINAINKMGLKDGPFKPILNLNFIA